MNRIGFQNMGLSNKTKGEAHGILFRRGRCSLSTQCVILLIILLVFSKSSNQKTCSLSSHAVHFRKPSLEKQHPFIFHHSEQGNSKIPSIK